MCLSVSFLLCVSALCISFVYLMAKEVEFCMIENVGRVDENALAPQTQTPIATSSFSDVKSVHFQTDSYVLNSDGLRFETIRTQVIA